MHCGILLAVGGLMLWAVFLKTGQISYPYPLDDSYIHLSISRTLADQGLWSPTPDRFEFSSSSPLFTLLLSGLFLISGPSLWWPMILNIAASLVLVWLLWSALPASSNTVKSLWLWVIIITTPIILPMLMGMEHALQLPIFLAWLIAWLQKQENPRSSFSLKLVLLTIAMVTIRYEGLFLLGAAGLWWLFQKRWKEAILLGCAGFLPVIALGLFSLSQGGTFLPLSLLMKGYSPQANLGSIAIWISSILTKLYEHPFIFPVLSISAAGMWMGGSLSSKLRSASFVLQVAGWVHVLFAEIGGYRYEAYLFLLHAWLLASILDELSIKITWRIFLASAWLLLPILIRTAYFSGNYPLAVQNIYHQSVQVGRFIERYYPTEHIAMHDIGVATWLSNFPLTDLASIGDEEVYELYHHQAFTADKVQELLERRGVRLAIIQQGWMGYVIPSDWRCAGSWTIQDHFIIALPEVFFWAKDQKTYDELLKNLRLFRDELPEGIVEQGPYVGTPLPEVKTPQ
ncbi:MAG: hypothetical protein NWR72_15430 [Bacteroidia bacterium]|nr:hypothetical protein [Bacteroidia bacterium]